VVERRGPTRDVIIALLDQGIRGSEKAFFTDREKLQAFADSLNTKSPLGQRAARRRAPGASASSSRTGPAATRSTTASISTSC
jgi:hypothetical protein